MTRPPMRLGFSASASGKGLEILWQMGDAPPRTVFFRSENASLAPRGDALLCLGLPPSMEVAAPLVLSADISRASLHQAHQISRKLCNWYPGLSPLELSAEATAPEASGGEGSAVFYSAGVDSSYSLLMTAQETTHLVTLIGADIPVNERARAERLTLAAKDVAASFGIRSIVVETNIREVSDRLIGWVEYHGAVLAAVGHMLDGQIGRFRIASSADEASRLRPWGTHPDLDALWGAGRLSFEHHALVPRFTKVAGILDHPALMKQLRVCDYDDGNCGRCPDCVFMLNALTVLDGFDRAPTFRKAANATERVIADGFGTRTDLLDMKAAAQSSERAPGLPRAIDHAIAQFDRRVAIDRITRWSALHRRFKRWKRRRRYLRAAASDRDSFRP